MEHKKTLSSILFISFFTLAALLAVASFSSAASAPVEQAQPLHPTFALLDENQANVLESGEPVSAIETCGQCHDTEFIATHSGHANLGFETYGANEVAGDHPWDQSSGYFGDWNALDYRFLSPAGDERIDLTTSEWVMAAPWRRLTPISMAPPVTPVAAKVTSPNAMSEMA